MTSSNQSPRPLLITLLALIFSGHVFVGAIFVLFVTFASSDTPFTYNGELVTIGDHRLKFLLSLIAYLPLAYAIAYGFWARKKWSQHIIPAMHLVALVGNLFFERRVGELIFVFFYVGLVFWYFYGKASVRAYYGVD